MSSANASPDETTEPRAKPLTIFLPALGGWFFLLMLAIMLFVRPTMLLWDGASCRHVLNGLYFFDKHVIPASNYVSALFPHEPAYVRCFGGDLLSATAYRLWQLNGVVLVAALALALALTWSYQLGRARGLGPVLGMLALVVTSLSTSLHWSARCHVFSYPTLMILFWLTFMASMKPLARLAATAAVMCVWANLHGSFVIGIALLSLKFIGDLLGAGWKGTGGGATRQGVVWSLATLLVSAAASLVNPTGLALIADTARYLAHPMTVMKGQEWRALDFSVGLPAWAFLLTFLAVMSLWVVAAKKPAPAEFLFFLGLFLAGVHSMRIIPYFALIAMPVAGAQWRSWRTAVEEEAEAGGPVRRSAVRFFALEHRLERVEQENIAACLMRVAVAAVMAAVFVCLPQLRVADFDPESLPVRAVDVIEKRGLTGLGFSYDNWGGYLYWRLGRPVFLDDWADSYPPPFLAEYVATMMAQPGWESVLDKYKVEFVLIPRSTLLGAALAPAPGWQLIYSDKVGELFVRRAAGESGVAR